MSEVLPEFAEVPPVAGGFPSLPLYALAAVPLTLIPIFTSSDNTPNTGTSPVTPGTPTNPVTPEVTPTPVPPSVTPPTTSVPEPASLLLFGSGLAAFGAAARRRYWRNKIARAESINEITGEVRR